MNPLKHISDFSRVGKVGEEEEEKTGHFFVLKFKRKINKFNSKYICYHQWPNQEAWKWTIRRWKTKQSKNQSSKLTGSQELSHWKAAFPHVRDFIPQLHGTVKMAEALSEEWRVREMDTKPTECFCKFSPAHCLAKADFSQPTFLARNLNWKGKIKKGGMDLL